MDLFRSIGSALFGWRYVTVIDCWGGRKVKRIEWIGDQAFARWCDYDIANVMLFDDGRTGGVSYVTAWKPYEPGAPRVWPSYALRTPAPSDD